MWRLAVERGGGYLGDRAISAYQPVRPQVPDFAGLAGCILRERRRRVGALYFLDLAGARGLVPGVVFPALDSDIAICRDQFDSVANTIR